MLQMSTNVQQTTEDVALTPAAVTMTAASLVPVYLDTTEMDSPVQVNTKLILQLAWIQVHILYISSPVRLSLFLSSVCRLLSCTLLMRLKFSTLFLRHLVGWPSRNIQVKFYGDRVRGTPPSGELNTRGVAESSDFVPIKRYISETVQDMS